MRNMLDFSSWPALLSTVLGLLLASLVMVGIRLVFMQTMQRRRERENRQINERLKTLIAAYKTLGGSFTGQLQVSPIHMRDLHPPAGDTPDADEADDARPPSSASTERQRCGIDLVHACVHGHPDRAGHGGGPQHRDGGAGGVAAPVHPRRAGPGAHPGHAARSPPGAAAARWRRRREQARQC